jgi:flagellar basal body rod protein FlgG
MTQTGELVTIQGYPVLDAGGAPIRLTPTEWQLLEVLVRHAGSVLEAITVRQAAGLPLPAAAVRGSQPASPSPA